MDRKAYDTYEHGMMLTISNVLCYQLYLTTHALDKGFGGRRFEYEAVHDPHRGRRHQV